MARTLIRGGTVVTATETMPADVLIDGEKVVGLAAGSSTGLNRCSVLGGGATARG